MAGGTGSGRIPLVLSLALVDGRVYLDPSFVLTCLQQLDNDVIAFRPDTLVKAKRASKMRLMRNAFRTVTRKNEINGKLIKEMTLEEEAEAREAERMAKEAAAAAQLLRFLEHEDKCCEPGAL